MLLSYQQDIQTKDLTVTPNYTSPQALSDSIDVTGDDRENSKRKTTKARRTDQHMSNRTGKRQTDER